VKTLTTKKPLDAMRARKGGRREVLSGLGWASKAQHEKEQKKWKGRRQLTGMTCTDARPSSWKDPGGRRKASGPGDFWGKTTI